MLYSTAALGHLELLFCLHENRRCVVDGLFILVLSDAMRPACLCRWNSSFLLNLSMSVSVFLLFSRPY